MKHVDLLRYRCKHCGNVLRPDGKGTYIPCSCGKVAVDGKYDETGEGYCRVIGNSEDYEEIKSKDFPELIKKKDIDKNLTISIFKSGLFYDIIFSGNTEHLHKLREENESSHYIDRSLFDCPVLIWDTTDTLEDAEYIVEQLLVDELKDFVEKNKEYIKWISKKH